MLLPHGVEIKPLRYRTHMMKVLWLASHGKTVLSLWRLLHIHHTVHMVSGLHPAWPHVLWRHTHVLLAHWVVDMIR